MGIPTCRFVDRQHEQFKCSICIDVAIDPVAMNDCDHIFCKSCSEAWTSPNCAYCQQKLLEPKWNPIRGSIKRIYLDLKMRCLNPSCDFDIHVSSYKDHDDNCPITFEICPECGFKSLRNPPSYHSCVNVLKTQLDIVKKKVAAIDQRLVTLETPPVADADN